MKKLDNNFLFALKMAMMATAKGVWVRSCRRIGAFSREGRESSPKVLLQAFQGFPASFKNIFKIFLKNCMDDY